MSDLDRPLCRERQIGVLENLLCVPGAKVPPLIFTYGLSATGKTHTVRWLLETRSIKHAVFHCVELYNVRLLYETILLKLTGNVQRCDSANEFINILKKDLHKDEVYVILFEESDRFRDTDLHIRQVFCRLSELTELNISCIWESKIDWTRFQPNRGLPAPFIINFPQYTRSEIQELLVNILPEGRSHQFKENYITMLLPIFYFVTRSLRELQHIAQVNYTSYCAPVEDGQLTEKDTKQLWFNIEQQLNKCISTVNLREVETNQMKELLEKEDEDNAIDKGSAKAASTTTRTTPELPYYSKFLLISAYLASYNPQRTDKRFFVKEHGKQRKSAHSIRAKERYDSKLTGPKPFPLERLLAIFYNIIEESVNPTANIYSQITSLVRLQLITAIGNDTVEQPKYRCNVDFEFAKHVAKNIKFDIQKYLYCQ
eukprot:TRINITY_DN5551_c0_g1_i7.p1 TRINITY_DN5551_c0_g1~~TRINITY_DN5551_c0_g1_i7.p1  ORF type:complete len:428 (-),score=59.39 TRINITY_DN5551_c0_g1_i7:247-1530(-)